MKINIQSKIIGLILIGLSILTFAGIIYYNSIRSVQPLIFSNNAMIYELWQAYKKEYIEIGSNRTLDRSRNNLTTSEGESYTMLRAVWEDDKDTFDKSWAWTKQYLTRKDDHLFSWMYGQKSDGTYGVITEQGGENSASDADTDIALALVFASQKWQDKTFMESAKLIIADIWDKEVVTIKDKPVLAADNLEKLSQEKYVVNPSYFAPYSYKIFSKIDIKNDWLGLADNSYAIINQLSKDNLDKTKSEGLVPDWVVYSAATGEIIPTYYSNLSSNYSYDAMRTSWRLALDYKWNNDPRAKEALQNFSLLTEKYNTDKALYSSYSHDGKTVISDESPAIYGGDLGYFIVVDPANAKDIYEKKLEVLYQPDLQAWKNILSYYDDNWAWFGMALYGNDLENLAADLK